MLPHTTKLLHVAVFAYDTYSSHLLPAPPPLKDIKEVGVKNNQ